MITLKITGRYGALTTFTITGYTGPIESLPHTGYGYRGDYGVITGHCSKKSIAELNRFVDATNLTNTDYSQPYKSRVLVAAGKYRIGQPLSGGIITGLGVTFSASADDYAANGIDPSAEYVQYAYVS